MLAFFFGAFATKSSKSAPISFCLSVRPLSSNNSRIAKRIFMTFDIWEFY
jgi:hypothetical protein